MNESCHTCEWVMSHIWMSHVTHMNESCHTYEWVMSHVWISHVTHMNESCHTVQIGSQTPSDGYKSRHTYEWVMWHVWMSHVTHMNKSQHMRTRVLSQHKASTHAVQTGSTTLSDWYESCHTYGWIMSHIWMSHVTPMNESCHTYEWVMSHLLMSHVTRMNESCSLISFMCVARLIHIIHMCGTTRDSWLKCACGMSHSCGTAHSHHSHVCDMTHSYVWHDSFICVTWLTHMCDMTHS